MNMSISRSKIAFASALLALICAGPSARLHATPPDVAEWARSPFNWTGFYIGMNIGGMLSNYDFRGTHHIEDNGGGFFDDVAVDDQFYNHIFAIIGQETGELSFFVPNHSQSDGAIMGGAQVGYQHQFGHFVAGVEAGFERTSTSATSVFRDFGDTQFNGQDGQALNIFGETNFESARRAETNWTASALAKLGYAQGPFLFYFIGGGTWADVNTTAHNVATTDFFTSPIDKGTNSPAPLSQFLTTVSDTNISHDNDTRFGWTAGGGIEIAASKTVSLALEYRHNDFGSETYHYASHDGIIFPGDTKVDFTSDQVTLKLNVLLNNFFSHEGEYAGTNPDERLSYANIRDGKDAKDKVVQLAPQEVFSWTGPYIGGHVGGVWTDFDFDPYTTDVDVLQQADQGFFNANPVPNGPQPAALIGPFDVASFRVPSSGNGSHGGDLDNNSDAGIIGGGQVGYNYQWHHWVFGAEFDFSGSTAKGWERFSDTQSVFVDESPFLGMTTLQTMRTVETDWTMSLRGRVGYACGRVMLYLTGGPMWTDVRVGNHEVASTDFLFLGELFEGNVTNSNKNKDEDVVMSWTGGGGIEWAFTKIASMALEYRHNFGTDETFNFDAHNGPIFPGSTNVDLEGDQVTFRVNFLLGKLGQP